MNPTTRTLNRVTYVIGFGHLVLAVLSALGRSGFGRIPPDPNVFVRSADNPVWIVIHLSLALAVSGAVVREKWRMPALSFSAGFLTCWSLLMLVWAVQLEPDATWAVTALGIALAAVSFVLSDLWADRE